MTRKARAGGLSSILKELSTGSTFNDTFVDLLDFVINLFKVGSFYSPQNPPRSEYISGDKSELFMITFETLVRNANKYNDVFDDEVLELISQNNDGFYFMNSTTAFTIAALVELKKKPDAEIYDPNCCSGRLLTMSAKRNREYKLIGVNRNLLCCKMTVVNLLMNCLQGEILWMDIPTMTHWKSWLISGSTDSNGYWIPLVTELGPEQSTQLSRIREIAR